MNTSSVTTKGQVVIPAELRARLGIRKGTRVCFLERGRELVLRPVTDEYIDSLRGSCATRGKALRLLREEKRRESET